LFALNPHTKIRYQQAYTYDTGNNLTNLSHQANSSAWQQILTIHPNNNHGTETQKSTSDFDANGNLRCHALLFAW
jgi:hypothetical protein